jgi:hypothetical protein
VSHLWTRRLLPTTQETIEEYTAVWPQILDFFRHAARRRRPGQLPGDPGLLAAPSSTEHIGLTRTFAEAMDGPRANGLTEHSLSESARARLVGIITGCQDRNGHGNRLDS